MTLPKGRDQFHHAVLRARPHACNPRNKRLFQRQPSHHYRDCERSNTGNGSTDFYSDNGDCDVEVGDYTGDFADVTAHDPLTPEIGHDGDETFKPPLWTDMDAPAKSDKNPTLNELALAARKVMKRMSTKSSFDICNNPDYRNEPKRILKTMTVSKLSFFSLGDMLKKQNGYALDTFLSYGPLNPSDCDDYSFGKIVTPAASQSLKFASEHVLEWHIRKSLLTRSPSLSPLSTTQRLNPAAAGFKKGKLLARDPRDPNSPREGDSI